jgi:hypothetical protein
VLDDAVVQVEGAGLEPDAQCDGRAEMEDAIRHQPGILAATRA